MGSCCREGDRGTSISLVVGTGTGNLQTHLKPRSATFVVDWTRGRAVQSGGRGVVIVREGKGDGARGGRASIDEVKCWQPVLTTVWVASDGARPDLGDTEYLDC